MAGCNATVGVRNIMLKFTNCNTGTVIGPIACDLADEKLPMIRASTHNSEPLPGGYTRVTYSSANMKFNVIRDLRIPILYYQDPSVASIDCQIEFINGLVYTAIGGSVSGKEDSDTHEVMLDLNYDKIDELLPAGALAATL